MTRALNLTLLALAACGPTPSDSATDTTDTTDTTGTASTGDPSIPTQSTATEDPAPTESSDTEPDPTESSATEHDPTDDPPACPQGEPALTPWWDNTYDAPTIRLVDGPIVTRADGRYAVGLTFDGPADSFGQGYLLVDPAEGENPTFTAANFSPFEGKVLDLVVAPDDGLVVVGVRFGDDGRLPYVLRFAPDGAVLGEFALPPALGNRASAVFEGDDLVIAGDGDAPELPTIARFTLDGEQVWSVGLPDQNDLLIRDLTRGPAGELVAAGQAFFNNETGNLDLVFIRIGADGEIHYILSDTRPPFDGVTAVAVTPAGHAVALVNTWDDVATSVVAVAIAVADGSPAWDTEIAGPDPDLGSAWARTILVDDAGLTIPVSRSHEVNQQAPSDLLTVEVVRLDLDGIPQSAALLPLSTMADAPATGQATRGGCGEFVMLTAPADRPRVSSHVPE